MNLIKNISCHQPGRVVTLIPCDDADSKVYGVAYKIPNEKRQEVMDHLDFREKNGYERCLVTFYPLEDSEQSTINNIIIYVATHENDSYAGHRNDLNDIANQIFEAHGPSGPNIEYLYRLADAMRQMFPLCNDEHLFQLEQILKDKEKNRHNG